MTNKKISNMKKKYDSTLFVPHNKFQKYLYKLISFGYKYNIAYKMALKKCKIDNNNIIKSVHTTKSNDSLIVNINTI